jgi:5-methyltetrahydrofolate--homocysteine methyltransferase
LNQTIEGGKNDMDNPILKELVISVTRGRVKDVDRLCREGLDSGLSAFDILDYGLLLAMQGVAERWKLGTIFIPEVLIAARALNVGLAVLEPHLVTINQKPKAKVIIGTVKDDLHDIGKNIVSLMLKSHGFITIDLGVDVAPEKFVEALKNSDARIICMSALLTTSMIHFKEVIEAVKEAGLRDQVLICVGGAPVTESFAHQIEADIFESDAVVFAERLEKRFE